VAEVVFASFELKGHHQQLTGATASTLLLPLLLLLRHRATC
jgi:hypothetical protein